MNFKKSILFTLFCIFAIGFVFAQNPNRTKQRKVKAKKSAKMVGKVEAPRKDPSWYKKDPDGDGVPVNRDKCPHTPKGVKVTPFGCPEDRDFDGIYDYEDNCPDVKGPRANQGCPWGDKDKDGILDKDDRCPDVFGLSKFRGCPDTDKDGLPDDEDKCPTQPGPRVNKGCPYEVGDSDNDGLADNVDKCPLTPGPIANKGCPELKPEEKKALLEAFKNLLFESDKDVIMSSSFSSLDKLAQVMVNNPTTQLSLVGHTDSQGDDQHNMDLSEARSKSVKRYLTGKGVGGGRITTEWFGETKPVDSNDTAEGRKHNRRVEMEISYK